MSQVVETKKRDITDAVLKKVKIFEESGQLVLPKDYSAANALKAAFLVLQEVRTPDKSLALDVCTPSSIANALLKMVVWGLSPLKKQVDFIPYGKTLTCQPEYTGNIALAKRYGGLEWIRSNAVFEGEEFEFVVDPTTGKQKLVEHKRDPKKFGGTVVGAYSIYKVKDEDVDMEYMSIEQIKNAWNQGQGKGQTGAHKNFTDQMAIKTVINRATKILIRSSDDSAILMGDDDNDVAKDAVGSEISDLANKQSVSFDPHEVVEETVETKPLPPKKDNPIENFESKAKVAKPKPETVKKESKPVEVEKATEVANDMPDDDDAPFDFS